MKNREISAMFDTMADVMEIQGENRFRVNSYRQVARTLADLTEDIQDIADRGELEDLPNVGSSSAEKIQEFLDSGRMQRYEELVGDFPLDALEMLKIPGLGPKTVGKLMDRRNITSIEQLEQAIRGGELDDMEGMGEKTMNNILHGIELVRQRRGRTMLGRALPVANRLISELQERCEISRARPAGSLRRGKETVGDVDILVTTAASETANEQQNADEDHIPGGADIVKTFTSLDQVAEVIAAGDTKGSIRTHDGLQVDVRVVRPESFGAALAYFTGSKAHNVHLRRLAVERDLKINEYGVFRGEERIAGRTEESVHETLDLPWIAPELREDRGEVEAAQEDRLPDLLTPEDIRGELHAHTDYSDGTAPALDMIHGALERGYEYLALTDHSRSLGVAGGLSPDDLKERNEEIDRACEQVGGFPVLKGTEVDIMPDGSLDYEDELLEDLDLVIAAVHTKFNLDEDTQTQRVRRAAAHPLVDIIAHPTGRLLGEREPYDIDMDAVIEACAETGTALELNSSPQRLDATDLACRRAKEAGVPVSLGTDSHAVSHLDWMQFGVLTARRGWLEPPDILNTRPVDELHSRFSA